MEVYTSSVTVIQVTRTTLLRSSIIRRTIRHDITRYFVMCNNTLVLNFDDMPKENDKEQKDTPKTKKGYETRR